jgi:hypothetical protein
MNHILFSVLFTFLFTELLVRCDIYIYIYIVCELWLNTKYTDMETNCTRKKNLQVTSKLIQQTAFKC